VVFRPVLENATPRETTSPILVLQVLVSACVQAGELTQARAYLAESEGTAKPPLLLFFEGGWELLEKALTARCDRARTTENRLGELADAFPLARLCRFARERVQAVRVLQRSLEISTDSGVILFELATRSELATMAADAGDAPGALPHLERCRQIVGAGENWLGLAGNVERAEAVVAAAQGEYSAAEAHFEKAVATYQRYCLPWEEADTLQYWGRALLAAGDRARAIEKFDVAIEIYRSRGAGTRFIEYVMADKIPAQGSTSTHAEAQSPPSDSVNSNEPAGTHQLQAALTGTPTSSERIRGDSDVDNVFHCEGDIWTITYEGQTLRLRDFKGLRYIALLLQHPGDEFHAVSLVSGVDSANGTEDSEARAELGALSQEQLAERHLRAGAPEDAGEMIDAEAKAAYGRRLELLREELEEAKELGNAERVAKAEDEIDAISRELSRAIGRGGRHRRAGSASERARLSVTNAIKVAIERVARKHSRLGSHLSASIRTGTYCCYRPDQNDTVWHF
jgi:tetratricopeptide (TPR) repeat protein